jgi:hypothetical protein
MFLVSILALIAGLCWMFVSLSKVARGVAMKCSFDLLTVIVLGFSGKSVEIQILAAVLIVLSSIWLFVILASTLRQDENESATEERIC